jgi:AraC-like DNA-binding protein
MKNDYQISSDYLFGLFEILEGMGESPIQLCEDLGIVVPESKMVNMLLIEKLVGYFSDHLSTPHIGLILGMKNGTTKHGMLGYAAKSCKTLGEAVQVDEEYLETRMNGVEFRNDIVNDRTEISLFVDEPLAHIRQFLVECILGSLISFFRELFPNIALDARVYVNYSAPEASSIYKTLTLVNWSFNQNKNALTFPKEILALAMPTYDGHLKELLIRQCASEIQSQPKDRSLSKKVRLLIESNLASPASLTEVAQHFGVNDRTLKRKLQHEGASYRDILIELRVTKAKELLLETELSVDDIAHQIGYSSPNTFKRLFKKWTNTTPGSIRKKSL